MSKARYCPFCGSSNIYHIEFGAPFWKCQDCAKEFGADDIAPRHPEKLVIPLPNSLLEVPIEDVAVLIANLRYDKLSEFILKLEDEVRKQSESDEKRGRKKLAGLLKRAHEFLKLAGDHISGAWKVSKPHMQ